MRPEIRTYRTLNLFISQLALKDLTQPFIAYLVVAEAPAVTAAAVRVLKQLANIVAAYGLCAYIAWRAILPTRALAVIKARATVLACITGVISTKCFYYFWLLC